MNIPGLKEAIIEKTEEVGDRIAVTREPIDILPNRRKDTIKDYLYQYGADVEMVVMGMNPSFKAAMRQALGRPLIIADRFHFVDTFTGRLMKSGGKSKRIGILMIEKSANGCVMYFINEKRN